MTIETDYSVDAGSLHVTFTPQSIAHYANGDDPVTIGHDSGHFYYGLMTFQCFANRFATINSASLVTFFNLSPDSGLEIIFYADDSDNSPWTNDLSLAYGKASNQTTATSTSLHPIGGTQTNVDITAVIQEIVNRAGWAAGNYLTMIVGWNSATPGLGQMRSLGDIGHGPYFIIDWTGGGGSSGPGGQMGANASFLLLMTNGDQLCI